MTRKEDYVSYEVAKLLNEKRYDEYCPDSYLTKDEPAFNYKEGEICMGYHEIDGECITIFAPTLWNTQKWLREKYNISVEIYTNASGYNWELNKAHKDCTCGTYIDGSVVYYDKKLMNDGGAYDQYEVALNEGIKGALKII